MILAATALYLDHLHRMDQAAEAIYAAPMCAALGVQLEPVDAQAILAEAVADGVPIQTAHVLWIDAGRREIERQEYLRRHMSAVDWVRYWKERCK